MSQNLQSSNIQGPVGMPGPVGPPGPSGASISINYEHISFIYEFVRKFYRDSFTPKDDIPLMKVVRESFYDTINPDVYPHKEERYGLSARDLEREESRATYKTTVFREGGDIYFSVGVMHVSDIREEGGDHSENSLYVKSYREQIEYIYNLIRSISRSQKINSIYSDSPPKE